MTTRHKRKQRNLMRKERAGEIKVRKQGPISPQSAMNDEPSAKDSRNPYLNEFPQSNLKGQQS